MTTMKYPTVANLTLAVCLIFFLIMLWGHLFEKAPEVPGGYQQLHLHTAMPAGGHHVIGPFRVQPHYSGILIRVNQALKQWNDWSVTRLTLLDQEKKKALLGIDTELYLERGRDSEGPWEARVESQTAVMTLPPGIYHLEAENELSRQGAGGQVSIRLTGEYFSNDGSLIVTVIIGVIALFLLIKVLRNKTPLGGGMALFIVFCVFTMTISAYPGITGAGSADIGDDQEIGSHYQHLFVTYDDGRRTRIKKTSAPSIRAGSAGGAQISGRGPHGGK